MNRDVFAGNKWKQFIGLGLLLGCVVLVSACKKPDAALTAQVKSKMAADTTVRALQIDVDTQNMVVTLKGNVDSKAEKDRAIQIARGTAGVRDVVDMISVKTGPESGNAPEPDRTLGERMDDTAITMAVKGRLLDDPMVKGLRIDVDTRDGIVYLTGTVATDAEKNRAVQLARETKDVRDVEANLTLARG